MLSFCHFRGRHFGFCTGEHMHRVLKQYDLVGKVTSTTTDNGSDMRKATTLSRVFDIRFRCIAHAPNIVVHKVLGLWPKKKSNTPEALSVSQSNPMECVLFFFPKQRASSFCNIANNRRILNRNSNHPHPLMTPTKMLNLIFYRMTIYQDPNRLQAICYILGIY